MTKSYVFTLGCLGESMLDYESDVEIRDLPVKMMPNLRVHSLLKEILQRGDKVFILGGADTQFALESVAHFEPSIPPNRVIGLDRRNTTEWDAFVKDIGPVEGLIVCSDERVYRKGSLTARAKDLSSLFGINSLALVHIPETADKKWAMTEKLFGLSKPAQNYHFPKQDSATTRLIDVDRI